MTVPFPAWLQLRESADADARARELLEPLRRRLAGPLVIRDLGSGTGSMARWLAPRLPGPQRWVLYDRDPLLLDRAASIALDPATLEVQLRDITTLTAADLAGTSLVTASALLDLLTADEVDRLAAVCVEASCPALLTLSVTGRVAFTPTDPLDEAIAAAFDAHQRRTVGGRRPLGPDAPDAAAEAFRRRGAEVLIAPSPWRLGPDDRSRGTDPDDRQAALISEWLRGWVGAACEQQPALAAPATAYLERRLAAAAAGALRVVVGHSDLLAYQR